MSGRERGRVCEGDKNRDKTHRCTKKLTVHGHFIDLRRVKLLNVTKNANILFGHKIDRNTLASKAS